MAAPRLDSLDSRANKNWIINGGMDFWQRGTNFLDLGDRYTADRWYRFKQNGGGPGLRTEMIENVSGAEMAVGSITNRAMRWGRKSGDNDLDEQEIVYVMETKDSVNLAGKTITFSFWARAGADFTQDLKIAFTAGEGFDQGIISAWTNDFAFTQVDKTITSVFQRYSMTITIPQNKTQIRFSILYIPVGTAGANEYVDITGLQLEEGTTPTAFKRAGVTIAGELTLCQRYYEKGYNVDVPPGTIVSPGTNNQTASTGTTISVTTPFKIVKRAIPVVILYSTGGAPNNIKNATSGLDLAASSPPATTFGFATNYNTATAINVYNWTFTADAEL